MSCTTDRAIALGYSGGGYLFEMHTGLVSRGACISWLSYYPHEREVCFGPMTALDVVRSQEMDENAVVVELTVVSVFHHLMSREYATIYFHTCFGSHRFPAVLCVAWIILSERIMCLSCI